MTFEDRVWLLRQTWRRRHRHVWRYWGTEIRGTKVVSMWSCSTCLTWHNEVRNVTPNGRDVIPTRVRIKSLMGLWGR